MRQQLITTRRTVVPFLLSFVRIKDVGEDLLSHILKLTPFVYLPILFLRVTVKEALSAKTSLQQQEELWN